MWGGRLRRREAEWIYGATVQFLLPTSFSQQNTHSAAGWRLHCAVCTQLDSTSPVLLLLQPSLPPGLAATSNKHSCPRASEEVNAGDWGKDAWCSSISLERCSLTCLPVVTELRLHCVTFAHFNTLPIFNLSDLILLCCSRSLLLLFFFCFINLLFKDAFWHQMWMLLSISPQPSTVSTSKTLI